MSIKDLRNKKCLITGAASGIGKATTLAAAREGAELFLTDINAASLETVAAEARELGAQVHLQRAFDIADFAAVQAFARDIHQAHGRSEERRVGKECVSTCRSRWSPFP